MSLTDASHARLVVAAQGGDPQAREELVAAYLPLLYNIVRRALGPHSDVDDVVQETLLRVVRDLPALREPQSFRSWLVAIAIRQIGSHRERQRAAGRQVMVVPEADDLPDEGFEDVTILRLHVSGQRREVAEASRWLDEEHRLLLSLWWQENAGWVSRTDLAAAVGLSVAHAGVRLQRMREQLETCREIVAALEMVPRCAELDQLAASWDGVPSPLWRKRIGRHVRGCRWCGVASEGQVPLERLLLTFLPLAVPIGLVAALAAKGLLPGAAAATAASLAAAAGAATATAAAAANAATAAAAANAAAAAAATAGAGTAGATAGAATAAGAAAGATATAAAAGAATVGAATVGAATAGAATAGAATAGAATAGGAGGMAGAAASGATAGAATAAGAAGAGGGVGAVPTTLIGKLAHSLIAHPVASMASGAAVVVFGSAVTMVTWPESPSNETPPAVIAAPPTPHVAPNPAVVPSTTRQAPPPRPAPSTPAATVSPAAPPAAGPAVPLGAWSLESVLVPGQFVTYNGDFAALQQVSAASSDQIKQQATLTVVQGLADTDCVTFKAADGRHLRHMMMRLRLNEDEGTQLFREDATFCPRPGAIPGSVSLESVNYPGQLLRYREGAFYLNLPDGSKNFGRETSFITRDPWAG